MVDAVRQAPVFGKRKEPHTVIIARGNEVRHFTIRPWMVALAGSAIAAVTAGYFFATAYLVLRDDLIAGAVAHQARLQQGYEDRISALRTQVDRITSRQLLDQQLVESKVTELMARQEALSSRNGKLGVVLQRALNQGLSQSQGAPTPSPRPDAITTGSIEPGAKGSRLARASAFFGFGKRASSDADATNESTADRADRLFVGINQSLRSIETAQLQQIEALTDEAHRTADQIADALDSAGLKGVSEGYGKDGVGGPLLPVSRAALFEAQVGELDGALNRLDKLKSTVRSYPLANPVPGEPVSSNFGIRRDPILGTSAMHAGLDFRAPIGTPIRASGSGTVISAGWAGGYGRMVEIAHADGYSTRYGHMSEILVQKGQKVSLGTPIGKSGNSGRSTGPHLHYEVRKDGRANNPVRYLAAGRKIEPLY